MSDLNIRVQYRDAEGKQRFLSTGMSDIDASDFEREVGTGSEAVAEDGVCILVAEGHYVQIPTHAIHRVDYIMNEGTK